MMEHYSKDNLPVPVEMMPLHRKTTLTPMFHVHGPLTVSTQEGDYTLGEDWVGFIAVDTEGFPYPVSQENYNNSYERADIL